MSRIKSVISGINAFSIYHTCISLIMMPQCLDDEENFVE